MTHTPIFQVILDTGSFSSEQVKLFKAINFQVWNDTGDYLDLEFEVSYKDKDKADYSSFNPQIVFNLTEKEVHLNLGTNFGDGWNDGREFPLLTDKTFGEQIKAYLDDVSNVGDDDKEYIRLATKYHDAHDEVISHADRIRELLLSMLVVTVVPAPSEYKKP
ncbi:hypothetical protein [Photobacterium kishitanii]|uniref:Uncharacterized protein n=1 Tax=Photobacterium kishitanii TaxID=318456 RepID=A0A2T3KL44_9GAMM|nr:hypothetical protein [Photobacterium kishitanii]PSV00367.1 hypothetical protein C9J27_04365 [Photobacterium kishitanii]